MNLFELFKEAIDNSDDTVVEITVNKTENKEEFEFFKRYHNDNLTTEDSEEVDKLSACEFVVEDAVFAVDTPFETEIDGDNITVTVELIDITNEFNDEDDYKDDDVAFDNSEESDVED